MQSWHLLAARNGLSLLGVEFQPTRPAEYVLIRGQDDDSAPDRLQPLRRDARRFAVEDIQASYG